MSPQSSWELSCADRAPFVLGASLRRSEVPVGSALGRDFIETTWVLKILYAYPNLSLCPSWSSDLWTVKLFFVWRLSS